MEALGSFILSFPCPQSVTVCTNNFTLTYLILDSLNANGTVGISG
jgi:hypothetical protein